MDVEMACFMVQGTAIFFSLLLASETVPLTEVDRNAPNPDWLLEDLLSLQNKMKSEAGTFHAKWAVSPVAKIIRED